MATFKYLKKKIIAGGKPGRSPGEGRAWSQASHPTEPIRLCFISGNKISQQEWEDENYQMEDA